VFGLGDPGGVAAILDQAALPERIYLTARPEHWPVVKERYRMQCASAMLRMVVDADAFRASSGDGVRRLDTADLGSVRGLYALGNAGDADGFAHFRLSAACSMAILRMVSWCQSLALIWSL